MATTRLDFAYDSPSKHPASLIDPDDLDDLARLRQRFREAEEAEQPNRSDAAEAIAFYYGDQWADDIERQRKQDGRPCFTLNKLPAILKQVLNEAQQNQPGIQINPVSDGADEDTAEVIQGLARHVETNSDGQAAYENAFVYMLIGGCGSWRILHDYLPKSFDQELFIEPIPNPFSVYWDPNSIKRDRSDAMYAFITSDLSKESHDQQFPDSELVGMSDFVGIGDQAPGWMSDKQIRVVEYFWIETKDAELVKLTDGRVIWEDEMKKGDRVALDAKRKPITRTAPRRVVWVGKSNGVEWLEKPEKLPTDDIPIVSIFGNEMIVDGERRYKGMTYDLMEAQRIFNFNSSAIAETMALGTKAQWTGTIEQVEPYMDLWKQSNSRNMAFLPYRNMPGVAPPQKIMSEPPIEAMSAARLQSADDLRSISGVYDATQSPSGGEESGKAILARRRQTSTGNLNYTAILAAGVKRTGQILLKYFPVIYDTARVVRITGADMQPKQVLVHSGAPESVPPLVQGGQLPDGVKGVFDLSVGTYDVTVSVGPTYDTRRQESVEMLLTLLQADPADGSNHWRLGRERNGSTG